VVLLRRRLAVVLATAMMLAMMVAAGPAFGSHKNEVHPFCGSGEEYARKHIKPLAQEQGLGPGQDGHTPGSHKGFSVCDPSGHAGS
jgi:hypothetical protein